MSQSPLGRTLIIANPAAHSGKGAAGAEFARHFLTSYSAATDGYELKLTTAMGDARVMAAEAADFDYVADYRAFIENFKQEQTADQVLFVTGSLYFIAEVRAYLQSV